MEQKRRTDRAEEEERLRHTSDEPENIRPHEPILADGLEEDEKEELARV